MNNETTTRCISASLGVVLGFVVGMGVMENHQKKIHAAPPTTPSTVNTQEFMYKGKIISCIQDRYNKGRSCDWITYHKEGTQ